MKSDILSYKSLYEYGARGNDKKDDTFAFLNAFKSQSDTLIIEEGTYYLHSTRVSRFLHGDKLIEGNGYVHIIDLDHTAFLFLTNQNVTLRNITFENFRSAITINSIKPIDFTLDNCIFIGDIRFGVTSSPKSLFPVSFYVNNCRFDGRGKSDEPKSRGGIWLNSMVDSVIIKNSTFHNFSSNKMSRAICITPIKKKGKYIKIQGNTIDHIHGNQNQEIQGIMVFGEQAIIENNTLSNIYAHNFISNDCEGIYTKVKNLEIKYNKLKDCGNREGAIVVKTFDRTVSPKSKIIGNEIEFTKKSINSKASGIVVRYPENTLIERNEIKNPSFIGIEVTGGGSSLSNVKILDNKVYNSVDAGLLLVGADGVSSNIDIQENEIIGANSLGTKKQFSPLRIVTGDTRFQSIINLNIIGNSIKDTKNCEADILLRSRFENHEISGVLIQENTLNSSSEYKVLFHTQEKRGTIGRGDIRDITILSNKFNNTKNTILKNKKKVKKLKIQEF